MESDPIPNVVDLTYEIDRLATVIRGLKASHDGSAEHDRKIMATYNQLQEVQGLIAGRQYYIVNF